MNLEETQRINLLAKTLQTQGIATSSLEAVEKANKIIRGTQGKEAEEDKIQLLEKKYKFLLEQNCNKAFNEINDVKDSMNSLLQELNAVKARIREQETKLNNQEIKWHEPKKVQEKTEDREEAWENHHPRQGAFKPEDVSIEKFFYYGEKEK